jgi:ABC-type sulfate transport system permease subunit
MRVNAMLPKGVTWKSARNRFPGLRQLLKLILRPRFLVIVAIAGISLLLWSQAQLSASKVEKYASAKING